MQIKEKDSKTQYNAPIVYSKINVKRNIDQYNFVNILHEDSKKKIEYDIIDYLNSFEHETCVYDLNTLKENQKKVFLDDSLVNNDFISQKDGKFIVFNNNLSLVLNNKDHLNFYSVQPDLSLKNAFKQIEDIEKKISKKFPFAASTKYGYLTTSVKECGLAMKITVLIHLHGINVTKKKKETFKLFVERGYSISQWKQADDEVNSDYYIISSNLNFGVSEKNLITRFIQGIENLIELNSNLLKEYYEKKIDKFVDTIFRSYGILKYAGQIDYNEALNHLSYLRTGLELGEKLPVNLDQINTLFIKIKDGYVSEKAEEYSISNEIARAKIIKGYLE